ncbi:aminodeoxychorismate synthase, component I [Trichinella spiralis]|uniref:aminodeoxychorismate synthase, component I n=1 Tax=Trichinella spiralis TaxID=6334 RepID=UPI0001EFB212|nr:aminodeoxychorismate synthase, component I [Trichinella spiralis]
MGNEILSTQPIRIGKQSTNKLREYQPVEGTRVKSKDDIEELIKPTADKVYFYIVQLLFYQRCCYS